MADAALIKKLHLRPGYRLLLLEAPAGYRDRLEPPPDAVEIDEGLAGAAYDMVHLFVRGRADVERAAPGAIAALRPGGLLWISYPKRSAKLPTDIHRDAGWEALSAAGWRGIAQISIDDTWSALRFRPLEEVGS